MISCTTTNLRYNQQIEFEHEFYGTCCFEAQEYQKGVDSCEDCIKYAGKTVCLSNPEASNRDIYGPKAIREIGPFKEASIECKKALDKKENK